MRNHNKVRFGQARVEKELIKYARMPWACHYLNQNSIDKTNIKHEYQIGSTE